MAEPVAGIRPDDPLSRPAVLAHAACRERSEHPRLLRPFEGAPVSAVRRQGHVRRCRGDRRGGGGVDGGRRLSAPSREVPEARGADTAWRAALRSAGHGQDAARPRGRGRGRRSVLLAGSLRVRRGDRRRRRVARARSLHAGEGGRPGDRVHRRARRDRPVTHGRRCRLQRRQRRTGADAEPDPDRDGRVRLVHLA